jgi:hypothetical protein
MSQGTSASAPATATDSGFSHDARTRRTLGLGNCVRNLWNQKLGFESLSRSSLEASRRPPRLQSMLGATNDAAMNALVVAAVFAGPLVAVAIFWFGLRSARRHDQAQEAASAQKPD